MDKLAIFDVDYTLTSQETQIIFLKFLAKKQPASLLHLPKSAAAGVLYTLDIWDEKAAKETHWSMLKGRTEAQVSALAKMFFDEAIKPILYVDALLEMRRLKTAGYRIILSSASPEFYIREFQRSPMVETAMGTRFEFKNGLFTASMIGKNNKGEEKVRRLLEYLGDEEIDWSNSRMYSDSLSDRPLLDMVGRGYLINHQPNRVFQVLEWK